MYSLHVQVKMCLMIARAYIVYCHTNIKNGKKYVGYTSVRGKNQTLYGAMMNRWKVHLDSVAMGSRFLFHNAIRKHGVDVWQHDVLDVQLTKRAIKQLEKLWVTQRGSYAYDDGNLGYNMTRGGGGTSGHVGSRGSCNVNWGKFGSAHPASGKRTPEQRAKISAGKKGWNPSAQTRQRMSAAQSIPVACFSTDGTLVKRYVSSKSTAEDGFSSLQVNRAVRGKTKGNLHKGFVWRYA